MKRRWLAETLPTFLITTDSGLESVLVDELRELVGSFVIERMFSGRVLITCKGCSVVNVLRSRIANNVYYVLGIFDGIESLNDVYRAVRSMDFSHIIEPDESFAIRPERVGEHDFTSVDIARVAGQAVIDSYMDSRKQRLKVNLDEPDVEVYVELNQDKLFVALKLTKTSLHKRGYKVFNHPASLKTTIAAAMLRIARWKVDEGLLDPMCGGATVLIEAGLIAKGIECVCFKKEEISLNRVIKRVDYCIEEEMSALCDRAPRPASAAIVGIEKNPVYAEGGVINAKFANVDDVVKILVGDCRKLARIVKWVFRELGTDPRVAVFNPPYGVRMKGRESMMELYTDVLRILEREGFERIVFITSAIGSAETAISKLRHLKKVERIYTVHGTLPSFIYYIEV